MMLSIGKNVWINSLEIVYAEKGNRELKIYLKDRERPFVLASTASAARELIAHLNAIARSV